ncbi:MAG: hypothetical protein V7K89_04545 [Nostoc sp.]|uniref:hypothetical protein n=1 Tax=Nostoc sp. TaxID=1180 RepID=UPI002FF7D6D4
MIAPNIGGIEEDMSVPYQDWLKVGKETLIVFDELLNRLRIDRTLTLQCPYTLEVIAFQICLTFDLQKSKL